MAAGVPQGGRCRWASIGLGFTFAAAGRPVIESEVDMSEPNQKKRTKIACSNCGQHLDVTELPAFSRAFCPACNTKLLVPMIIGNYQLLSPMGSGGMGTVYKAFDTALQRFVAVKLMKKELAANPQFVADFTREARAAASLNHPNIAQILSFGQTNETDGQYYIVMELLEGSSLDHMIETHKRVAELDVLNIGIQVASALKAAYHRGVIHRDIKPGNILFNSESQAKVVDFGLAQFAGAEEEKRQEDGIWGTPYYIAPEKLNGEREDFRSDMYSLGGTMFHALAGRPPFEANTATEVVLKHLREPALSLKTFAPDICDQTMQAIGCMLRKNREDRYSSYDELIEDLEEAKRSAVTHQRGGGVSETQTAGTRGCRRPQGKRAERFLEERYSHNRLAGGLRRVRLFRLEVSRGSVPFQRLSLRKDDGAGTADGPTGCRTELARSLGCSRQQSHRRPVSEGD